MWHDMILTYDFTKGSDDDIAPGWSELVTVNTDAYAGCLWGAADDAIRGR